MRFKVYFLISLGCSAFWALILGLLLHLTLKEALGFAGLAFIISFYGMEFFAKNG